MMAPEITGFGTSWVAPAVGVTILWSGLVSLAPCKLIDATVGLRFDSVSERQGLDLSSHGASAYHM